MGVIAYAYEADYHCTDCTIDRFGIDKHGFVPESARDSEGNPIGAVFSWDEWYANDMYEGNNEAVLSCSDCHEEIERVLIEY